MVQQHRHYDETAPNINNPVDNFSIGYRSNRGYINYSQSAPAITQLDVFVPVVYNACGGCRISGGG